MPSTKSSAPEVRTLMTGLLLGEAPMSITSALAFHVASSPPGYSLSSPEMAPFGRWPMASHSPTAWWRRPTTVGLISSER